MTGHEDCPDFDPAGSYAASADPASLLDLAGTKMPFGRYAGHYLSDLPEHYLLWFRKEGFPEGDLGRKMAIVCEMKANGLEHLLRTVRGMA